MLLIAELSTYHNDITVDGVRVVQASRDDAGDLSDRGEGPICGFKIIADLGRRSRGQDTINIQVVTSTEANGVRGSVELNE